MKTEHTKGILDYLEHIYHEGKFVKSDLHINEGTWRRSQDFFGYVSESVVGKEVNLYQDVEGKILFQRLTIQERNLTYQVRATSKMPKPRRSLLRFFK